MTALTDREQGLPSWRELLYVYRRLEARGEQRGGRFVQGIDQIGLRLGIERGRRLVQNQDPGLFVKCLGDLDQLLHAKTQPARFLPRIDGQPPPFQPLLDSC